MIDWLIIFSVLLAVLAMFRTTVKRIMVNKMQGVGNFMVWQRWDGHGGGTAAVPEDSEWFKADKNIQMKTGMTSSMTATVHERQGVVNYNGNQARSSRMATLSTPKDQEYLLANQALGDVPVTIDPR